MDYDPSLAQELRQELLKEVWIQNVLDLSKEGEFVEGENGIVLPAKTPEPSDDAIIIGNGGRSILVRELVQVSKTNNTPNSPVRRELAMRRAIERGQAMERGGGIRDTVNADLRAKILDVEGITHFDSPEFRNSTLGTTFADVTTAADAAQWPNQGRVAIATPGIYRLIYGTRQAAYGDERLMYMGWEIVKDVSAKPSPSKGGSNQHTVFYLVRNQSLGFACHIQLGLNREIHAGWFTLSGLFNWGSGVIDPEKVMYATINVPYLTAA